MLGTTARSAPRHLARWMVPRVTFVRLASTVLKPRQRHSDAPKPRTAAPLDRLSARRARLAPSATEFSQTATKCVPKAPTAHRAQAPRNHRAQSARSTMARVCSRSTTAPCARPGRSVPALVSCSPQRCAKPASSATLVLSTHSAKRQVSSSTGRCRPTRRRVRVVATVLSGRISRCHVPWGRTCRRAAGGSCRTVSCVHRGSTAIRRAPWRQVVRATRGTFASTTTPWRGRRA